MTDVKTKEVSVAKMVEPKFLTLCKKPSNRAAFKIVRSADGGTKRIRRLMRAMSPSVVIDFPDGTTKDQVTEIMDSYGFEGYTVSETEVNGVTKYKAYRSDLKEQPETDVSFLLKDGIRLHTRRAEPKAPKESAGISLVVIEFNKEQFTDVDACASWLGEKGIDFDATRVQNSETSILYRRADTPAGAEIGKVGLDNGVSFHVARADVTDVPSSVIEVISETAYGNWGWGQLDFGAMLADVEFSEAAREGLRVLDDLLYTLLFWSSLPLAVRKDLLARALDQFKEYVNGLFDALPPKTVICDRS